MGGLFPTKVRCGLNKKPVRLFELEFGISGREAATLLSQGRLMGKHEFHQV
jgi:hypothetical protein